MSLTSSAKRHGAWGWGKQRRDFRESESFSHENSAEGGVERSLFNRQSNENLKFQKEDCDVVINTKASCLWIDTISSNNTLWKWVQTTELHIERPEQERGHSNTLWIRF